jgi:PAS domain S-box-containing protein
LSARSKPDFRTLFEGAPDRYLVLDRDLRIVAASDAYLAATMTRREDLVGRVIFEVFPADPADPVAMDRERLIRSSLERVRDKRTPDAVAVQKHDIPRPSEQGGEIEVRYWSLLHSPVVDQSNQVSYIIHRVEDVTEYVQLQELGDRQQAITDELLDRRARMEAEILRRSQELQTANDALHQANEAKSAFLSLVSHELRTPLTAMLGFSELLATRSDLGEKDPAMLGRLGIDLAEQHQPDLILLDLHLPDLNGDEVLATLQASGAEEAAVAGSACLSHEADWRARVSGGHGRVPFGGAERSIGSEKLAADRDAEVVRSASLTGYWASMWQW